MQTQSRSQKLQHHDDSWSQNVTTPDLAKQATHQQERGKHIVRLLCSHSVINPTDQIRFAVKTEQLCRSFLAHHKPSKPAFRHSHSKICWRNAPYPSLTYADNPRALTNNLPKQLLYKYTISFDINRMNNHCLSSYQLFYLNVLLFKVIFIS